MSTPCPYCRGKPLPTPIAARLYTEYSYAAYVKLPVDLTDYGNCINVTAVEAITVVGIAAVRVGLECIPRRFDEPRHLIPGDILSVRGALNCLACGDEGTTEEAMRRKFQGRW